MTQWLLEEVDLIECGVILCCRVSSYLGELFNSFDILFKCTFMAKTDYILYVTLRQFCHHNR